MHTPLALGCASILAVALAVPACAADTIKFQAAHVASLASSKTVATPETQRTFALAIIAEDTYFEPRPMTLKDAKDFVAHGMTEGACIAANRLVNAYGGFTVCIPE